MQLRTKYMESEKKIMQDIVKKTIRKTNKKNKK